MNIPLTPSTYQIVPEGYHTFRIKSATYEDKFGRVTIVVETKDGSTITEKYGLIDPTTRQPVEGAMKAFSYFVRIALQDWNIADVDPESLVGHFIAARVEHTLVESKTRIGETLKFPTLKEKWSCNGFDDFSMVKDRDGNPIPIAPVAHVDPIVNPNTLGVPQTPTPTAQSSAPVQTPPVAPAVQPTPTPVAPKSPFDLSALFGK